MSNLKSIGISLVACFTLHTFHTQAADDAQLRTEVEELKKEIALLRAQKSLSPELKPGESYHGLVTAIRLEKTELKPGEIFKFTFSIKNTGALPISLVRSRGNPLTIRFALPTITESQAMVAHKLLHLAKQPVSPKDTLDPGESQDWNIELKFDSKDSKDWLNGKSECGFCIAYPFTGDVSIAPSCLLSSFTKIKFMSDSAKETILEDETVKKQILACLNLLGSDDFEKRNEAEKKLFELRLPALKYIQAEMESTTDLEIKSRCQNILATASSLLLQEKTRDVRGVTEIRGPETPVLEITHPQPGEVIRAKY